MKINKINYVYFLKVFYPFKTIFIFLIVLHNYFHDKISYILSTLLLEILDFNIINCFNLKYLNTFLIYYNILLYFDQFFNYFIKINYSLFNLNE